MISRTPPGIEAAKGAPSMPPFCVPCDPHPTLQAKAAGLEVK